MNRNAPLPLTFRGQALFGFGARRQSTDDEVTKKRK